LIGYLPEDLIKNAIISYNEIIHPGDRQSVRQVIQDAIDKHQSFKVIYRIKTSHGQEKWVWEQGNAIYTENGDKLYLEGLISDITKLFELERSLNESVEHYRLITENLADIVWIMDPLLNFTYVSPSVQRMTGYTPEEFIGTNLSQHATRKEFLRMSAEAFKAIKDYRKFEQVTLTTKVLKKDGEELPVEITGKLVRNEKGLPIGLQGATRDISERAKSESKLRQSEKQYRELFENMTEGFVLFKVVKDKNGIPVDLLILSANKNFESATGLKIQNSIGKRLTHELPGIEKDKTDWIETFAKVAETGKPNRFEQYSELLERFFLVTAYQSGQTNCAVIFTDITNHKLAEKALEDSEERYRQLVHRSPNAIGIYQDEKLVYVNPAAIKLLGAEKDQDLLGKSLSNFIHPDAWLDAQDRIARMLNGELGLYPTHDRFLRLDGSVIDVEITFTPFSFNEKPSLQIIASDITKQLNSERIIRQYEHIVSSSTDMLALIDKNLTYITANPAYLKSRNFSFDQLVGKKVIDVVGEEKFYSIVMPNIQKCLQGAVVNYQEEFFVPALGKRVLDITYFPHFGKENEILGFVLTARDITKEFQSEQFLQALNLASRNMGTALSAQEVFSCISDELRKIDTHCMFLVLDDSQKMFRKKYLSFEPSLISQVEKIVGFSPIEFSFEIEKIDIIKKVLISRKTFYLEDFANIIEQVLPSRDKRLLKKISEILDIGKSIITPVAFESRDIGIFSVHSEKISTEDIPAITAFSNQLAVALRNAELLKNLSISLGGTIKTLANTVEARDPYTSGHQQRVAHLAVAIAAELELDQRKIEAIDVAATIHDLGKIKVPAEILSKPGRLSDLEFGLIRTHPQVGYELLRDITFPWPIADIIHQHHEKMNGSGYPQGLNGDEIIFEAKIITVADIVEAMSSHRPYRPALGEKEALSQIKKDSGVLLDPAVVTACLKVFKNGYKFPDANSK